MSKKFKNKQKIIYLKERALLSDTLPYETPAIFSNRYFYRFLINNDVEINNDEVKFNQENEGIKEVIALLLNVEKVPDSGIDKWYFSYKKDKKSVNKERNIPFTFKIAHKENDFRNLSLIHPLNQLMVVNFYDTYKDSIRYFSNQNLKVITDEFFARIGKLRKNHAGMVFDVGKSALLVVDMQNYFLSENSHAFIPSADAIMDNINLLTDFFSTRNRPIIFTRHIDSAESPGGLSPMEKWWNGKISNDD
ncbi:isochorismatase family protein, partial [bacterium]|nr:isochorismatase family protein [bacterium]